MSEHCKVRGLVYKMSKDFFQIRKLILGTKNGEVNSYTFEEERIVSDIVGK